MTGLVGLDSKFNVSWISVCINIISKLGSIPGSI